jgi:hypothetical protein
MLSKLKNSLRANLINYKGWTTNRKIVVIESDDWGAIRLPDVQQYEEYKQVFPNYSRNPYLKYDSLASEYDLTRLFSVLTGYKDKNGNHPVFTFNVVMTNPDFTKIEESDFTKYYNESFTTTLQRFSQHTNSFALWRTAIDEKLMLPQFHGREHVNVPIWLKILEDKKSLEFSAFQFGTWSCPDGKYNGINLQAALDWNDIQPLSYQKDFLNEGLKEFESVFGFTSDTIIPNNYIFDENLYDTLLINNVKGMQGMKYQKLSLGASKGDKRSLIRRHIGDSNEAGLTYLVRNCSFEPSQTSENYEDVTQCLQSISNAFFFNKPAIIDSHRLNYIGTYNQKNSDANLKKLEILISSVLKKWPDVEFMTSNQLLQFITKNSVPTIQKK